MAYKLQRHVIKRDKSEELKDFDIDFLRSYPDGKINVGDITGKPIISMMGLRILPRIFEVYGYIEEYPYSSEVISNVPYKYLNIDVDQIKRDDRASGSPHYAYVLHKEVFDEIYEYLQAITSEYMMSPLRYIFEECGDEFEDIDEYYGVLTEEIRWLLELDKEQLNMFPENYSVQYMCYPSLSWAFAYGKDRNEDLAVDEKVLESIEEFHVYTLAESITYLTNLSDERITHTKRLSEITGNNEYVEECETLVERLDAIDIEENAILTIKEYYESEGLKFVENSV